MFARRGVLVDLKALLFSQAHLVASYHRLAHASGLVRPVDRNHVIDAYGDADDARIRSLVHSYGITHAVYLVGTGPQGSRFPIEYEDGNFTVYRTTVE